MECKDKKSADAGTPTLHGDTSLRSYSKSCNPDYSRMRRISPFLLRVAVVGFLICYHFKNTNMMYLYTGVMITTALFNILLFPIEEDDDE